ncbi:MAG: hypothetical protein VZS44_05215 [Bacilli bacterium]|nr:hypothetical protein [Bacilli bacterium]
MKLVKIQFPKDSINNNYDGKIHTVKPVELESFKIRNDKYYILRYEEDDNFGITVLGKDKDNNFFKIPLDNYEVLFDYLEVIKTKKESLTLLNNQNIIDTIDIQNAEQFLSEKNKLPQKNDTDSSNPPNPPDPPRRANDSSNPPDPPKRANDSSNPPDPPKRANDSSNPPDPPFWKIESSEPNNAKTALGLAPPSQPPKSKSKDELKKVKIYVGFYNNSYAAFLAINRSKIDVNNSIFRFGRYPYNEKLEGEIRKLILKNKAGKKEDTIYIDYGKNGDSLHLIDSDLYNLSNYICEDEFFHVDGKYCYNIVLGEFINYEDFKKFLSSDRIECVETEDMNFRFIPSSHDTIFLNLANSDVIATFKDYYGYTKVNSFAEKLGIKNNKRR